MHADKIVKSKFPASKSFESKDYTVVLVAKKQGLEDICRFISRTFPPPTTTSHNRVIRIGLPSQSAYEKHNQEKSPQTFAHLVNFSIGVSAVFDNHTILLFWL